MVTMLMMRDLTVAAAELAAQAPPFDRVAGPRRGAVEVTAAHPVPASLKTTVIRERPESTAVNGLAIITAPAAL